MPALDRALALADCQVGKYKSTLGNEACTQCPTSSTTLALGSNQLASCVCIPGFSGLNGGPCIGL